MSKSGYLLNLCAWMCKFRRMSMPNSLLHIFKSHSEVSFVRKSDIGRVLLRERQQLDELRRWRSMRVGVVGVDQTLYNF